MRAKPATDIAARKNLATLTLQFLLIASFAQMLTAILREDIYPIWGVNF
jgi:hypothetical protein